MSKQQIKPYKGVVSRLDGFYVQRNFSGNRKSHDAVRNLFRAHGVAA